MRVAGARAFSIVSLRSMTTSSKRKEKSFGIHRDMAEGDAGGKETPSMILSGGKLKSLIKESICELFRDDPTLLDSKECRHDSDRTIEEGNRPVCIHSR